jgi:tetratricopeptide (TPR) repeat protein
MINLIRAVFASLLLLILSGCAFLNSFNNDLDKQVDIWMAQHEYSKVLDTLQYIRPSNPKYQLLQRKRQQAIEESKRYQQAQIANTLNLIEKGQWHEAELTLNDAIEKLPDSQPLHKTYQEFIKQRAQYLKSLYNQLYINKAEWLVKDKPVQQQLSHTLPDDRKTQQALEDFRKDIQHVYQQLLVCGSAAAQVDDLELAEQCYQLANKLQPSPAIKNTLVDIQEKLDRKLVPSPQPKQQTPAISQLGRNLLEKSKKAVQAGNLKLALSLYNKIPSADKSLGEIKTYNDEMTRRIRENVNQGIELGRKLYSQGQVEQALAIWNKLRDLDPDNENLLSHIDRAEHVLEKIKQLRKEQKSETAPASPDSNK